LKKRSSFKKSTKIKLPLFLRKSVIFNYPLSQFRKFKRHNQTSSKSTSSGPNIKINIKKRFIIIAILIAVLGVLGLHINQLSKISPIAYGNNQNINRPLIDGVEYNTLFLLTRKQNDDIYIELASILSQNIEKGNLTIYSMHPYLLLSQDENIITINNLFNNVDFRDINLVTKQIEEFTGIRIDRYMLLDQDYLKTIINDWSIDQVTTDDFTYHSDLVKKDTRIWGDKLIQYVLDENIKFDEDKVLERRHELLKNILLKFKNSLFIYQLFWNSESILSNIKTNLTKDEFIDVILGFNSMDLPFNDDILGVNQRDRYKTTSYQVIYPNTVEVVKSINLNFNSIDLQKEQARIEIFNTTQTLGLADKVRKRIENLGSKVIKTGNLPTEKETVLYIPKGDVSLFVNNINVIQRTLRGKLRVQVGSYEGNYSGDMILVLGEDLEGVL
jgi:anionic cell wall polymer biosynthesis LytR-Cps2A-Psr (LCP) family protein